MSDNRRSSPRVSLDAVVNCGANAIAHAHDISSGGICLILEAGIESGTIIQLSFQLPGRPSPIQAFGKVAWCRPAGEHLHTAGLEFWDISGKDHDEITSYLRQRIEV